MNDSILEEEGIYKSTMKRRRKRQGGSMTVLLLLRRHGRAQLDSMPRLHLPLDHRLDEPVLLDHRLSLERGRCDGDGVHRAASAALILDLLLCRFIAGCELV